MLSCETALSKGKSKVACEQRRDEQRSDQCIPGSHCRAAHLARGDRAPDLVPFRIVDHGVLMQDLLQHRPADAAGRETHIAQSGLEVHRLELRGRSAVVLGR